MDDASLKEEEGEEEGDIAKKENVGAIEESATTS